MIESEGTAGRSETLANLLRSIEDGPELPAFRNNVKDLLAIQGKEIGLFTKDQL